MEEKSSVRSPRFTLSNSELIRSYGRRSSRNSTWLKELTTSKPSFHHKNGQQPQQPRVGDAKSLTSSPTKKEDSSFKITNKNTRPKRPRSTSSSSSINKKGQLFEKAFLEALSDPNASLEPDDHHVRRLNIATTLSTSSSSLHSTPESSEKDKLPTRDVRTRPDNSSVCVEPTKESTTPKKLPWHNPRTTTTTKNTTTTAQPSSSLRRRTASASPPSSSTLTTPTKLRNFTPPCLSAPSKSRYRCCVACNPEKKAKRSANKSVCSPISKEAERSRTRDAAKNGQQHRSPQAQGGVNKTKPGTTTSPKKEKTTPSAARNKEEELISQLIFEDQDDGDQSILVQHVNTDDTNTSLFLVVSNLFCNSNNDSIPALSPQLLPPSSETVTTTRTPTTENQSVALNRQKFPLLAQHLQSPSDSSASSEGSTAFTLKNKETTKPKQPLVLDYDDDEDDDIVVVDDGDQEWPGRVVVGKMGTDSLVGSSPHSSQDPPGRLSDAHRMPSLMDESSTQDGSSSSASSAASYVVPADALTTSPQQLLSAEAFDEDGEEDDEVADDREELAVSPAGHSPIPPALPGQNNEGVDTRSKLGDNMDQGDCLLAENEGDGAEGNPPPVALVVAVPDSVSPSLSSLASSSSNLENNKTEDSGRLQGRINWKKNSNSFKTPPTMEYLEGPDEIMLLRQIAMSQDGNDSVCSDHYEFEGFTPVFSLSPPIEDELPLLQSALDAFDKDVSFDWRTIMEEEEEEVEARCASSNSKMSAQQSRGARSCSNHRRRTNAKSLLLPIPSLREELETCSSSTSSSSSSSLLKYGDYGTVLSPSTLRQEESVQEEERKPKDLRIDTNSDERTSTSSTDSMDQLRLSLSTEEGNENDDDDELSPSRKVSEKDRRRERADSHMLLLPIPSLREDEATCDTQTSSHNNESKCEKRESNGNDCPAFISAEMPAKSSPKESNTPMEESGIDDDVAAAEVDQRCNGNRHALDVDHQDLTANGCCYHAAQGCSSESEDGCALSSIKEQHERDTCNLSSQEDEHEDDHLFIPFMDSVVARYNERSILSTVDEDPEPDLAASLQRKVESLLVESHKQRLTIADLRQAHDMRVTPFRDALEHARQWKEELLQLKQKREQENAIIGELQTKIMALAQAVHARNAMQLRLEESEKERKILHQSLKESERARQLLEEQVKAMKMEAAPIRQEGKT
ncbi:hypothetical protein ACA910_015886 [Epithemia clementina (nom. ined.)]